MAKEPLNISNLDFGAAQKEFNKALKTTMDEVLKQGGKGAVTLKVNIISETATMGGVEWEVNRSTPKTKGKGVYAKGEKYYEAEPVTEREDRQLKIVEMPQAQGE